MENQITRRVSRLFPSPFGSCRYGTVSEVAGATIIISRTPSNAHPIEPVSLMTKPKSSATPKNAKNTKKSNSGTETTIPSLNSCKTTMAKQSVIVKNSSSSNGGWFSSEEEDIDGESDKFFSLSPISSDSSRRKTSKSRLNKPKPRRRRGKSRSPEMGRSKIEVSSTSRVGFCSETDEINSKSRRKTAITGPKTGPGSEVEDRIECFFADSGRARRKTGESSRRRSGERRWPVVVGAGGGSKVEESYAVVKDSSNPYGDFRESMVEMIVEKSIYGAEDLEKLLQCFLSLNSSYHHSVILNVFSEICEALVTH
ncbi:hypothetical protein ACSBR2_037054 [Camellia fascicularis]